MDNFNELGLSEPILRALPEMGITEPTEIQQKAIPALLAGTKNLIGLAQTGTGKTAAFGLPLLQQVNPTLDYTQALILAPTRELGQQIAVQLAKFSQYIEGMDMLAVYGGASIVDQLKALKRSPKHIIIATPGRLLDLIHRKAIKLEQITHLVLDEADEMLNMGFQEDIDKILAYSPDEKATWLFSATMPREIRNIVNKYMTDHVEVSINASQQVNVNIEHQYAMVQPRNKTEAIKRFLDINPKIHGIVFCRTRLDTQRIAEELMKQGYQADALHGDMSQNLRDRVMRRFKAHSIKVLIATDVAARGIDVDDLTHIIHHNLPDDPSYYTHRSGRTARAGKYGISLAIIGDREMRKIRHFEQKLGIDFQRVLVPNSDEIKETHLLNWANRLLENKDQSPENNATVGRLLKLFDGVDKYSLINMLVTQQLKKLNYNSKDLNLSEKKRDSSKEKRGSSRTNETDSAGRFFINIGSFDNMQKGDLVNFISSNANVRKDAIQEVTLNHKYAYFSVTNPETAVAVAKLNGKQLQGREIRVNPEKQASNSGGSNRGKGKGRTENRRRGRNSNESRGNEKSRRRRT